MINLNNELNDRLTNPEINGLLDGLAHGWEWMEWSVIDGEDWVGLVDGCELVPADIPPGDSAKSLCGVRVDLYLLLPADPHTTSLKTLVMVGKQLK